MLNYFPSYKITARLISFLAPLVVFFIIFLVTGYNVLQSGITGGVAYLVSMIILLFLTGAICSRMADKKSDELVALYNQQCDPEAFVREGARVGRIIWEDVKINGSTEQAAWYLVPFSLACLDCDTEHGEVDAQMIEQALIDGMPANTDDNARSAINLQVEQLTLRLHGVDAALNMLYDVRNALEHDNSSTAHLQKNFLENEISYLEVLKRGNSEEMLEKFEQIWQAPSNPRRMRVLNAEAAAGIYEAQGNNQKQIQALQFVVDHGNKLPSVQRAKQKLEVISR